MTKRIERCKKSSKPIEMTQHRLPNSKLEKWKDGPQVIMVFCPACFSSVPCDFVVKDGIATGVMGEHEGVVEGNSEAKDGGH
jgi:hypothetical protein